MLLFVLFQYIDYAFLKLQLSLTWDLGRKMKCYIELCILQGNIWVTLSEFNLGTRAESGISLEFFLQKSFYFYYKTINSRIYPGAFIYCKYGFRHVCTRALLIRLILIIFKEMMFIINLWKILFQSSFTEITSKQSGWGLSLWERCVCVIHTWVCVMNPSDSATVFLFDLE